MNHRLVTMVSSISFGVMLVAAAAAAEPTRDYTVRDGDTCLGIVTRELGSSKQLEVLHRLNPGLGPAPHKLKPGQILKLPGTSQVVADAQLRTPRGKVEVRKAGVADWTAGAGGDSLFRTWRVGTRQQSSARIEFVDSSTIDMREDTVVVIFGPSSTQQPMARTSLERGALRSRLAALDGKPRMTVSTPSGTAELGEGSALVEVGGGGETRLANHGGKPAQLQNAKGKVKVGAGFGSKVVRDKPPTTPTPLPPAPTWVAASELVLAWAGDAHPLRGEWAPVATAQMYRIEIARTDAVDVVEARLEVPATITKLEAANLPAADYVVTVSSVDAGGFEGVASAGRFIQVVELTRPAPVVIGAPLALPKELSCRAGMKAPEAGDSAPVLVGHDADDRARITCTTARGTATAVLEVPPPKIAVVSAAATTTIYVGETSTIDVETVNVDPTAVRATGRGGVEIAKIEPTPRGVRLTIRAAAAAPGASIEISLAGSTELLGSVPIGVDQRVVASPVRPAISKPPLLAVTATGGLTGARADNAALIGAEVGIRVSKWVWPHLGVERIFASDPVTTVRAGLTAAGPWRVRPVGQLAAYLESSRLAVDAGAGLEVVVAPWMSIRAMANVLSDYDETRVHLTAGVTLRR